MIEINDKSRCSGCGSCVKSCPFGALSMQEDKAGFLYPVLDKKLCTDCGLCESLCPVLNQKNQSETSHSIYIAYAKDKAARFCGSSGGMFGLVAKNELKKGATVYGAAFDKDLKLRTTAAKNEDELLPLYKSKYLQSDLGDSFFKIKEKLKAGEKVLFVSAPCQVKALKLFLGQDYENLVTMDFVCHGVPSQNLFDKCRAYTERERNIKITEFMFRAKKKNGSTPHYYKMKYIKNGKECEKTALYLDDYFYTGFQKYITLRDSCYDCQFAFESRASDITMGDFHEVDKYIKGINRFDGVSCLVVNTEKGEQIWNEIKNDTVYHEMDFKLLISRGELMAGGTKKPPKREEFIKDLESGNFELVVSRYLNDKKDWTKKLYYLLPRPLRNIMKRIWIRQ